MFLKERVESKELKLLRSLSIRGDLSEKEYSYYLNLKKGFEGELRFDEWTRGLTTECLILNDLLFEKNNSVFQLDSLLLAPEKIYLFEVKNFEGDYYLTRDGKWYSKTGIEIKDPLNQLQRNVTLLRQLLHDFKCNIPIEGILVFVNQQFYLYQAPLNSPIIFPTQIDRYISTLNSNTSKLKDSHWKLAEQLQAAHLTENPLKRIHNYNGDELKRGVACAFCNSLDVEVIGNTTCCKKCGGGEPFKSTILRTVDEYKILYPERNITTNTIYDFCNLEMPKRRVRWILSSNFELVGYGRSSYYDKSIIHD